MVLDNCQGETLILAVIVEAPDGAAGIRRVQILSKLLPGVTHTERVVLYLRTGDGYSMDGVMQQHYTHGVERVTAKELTKPDHQEGKNGRIAIVFRNGIKVLYKEDSGSPCLDLKPPEFCGKLTFGNVQGLVEGNIYSRGQLSNLGAHRSQQRGASGNQGMGCDAIIVSGKKDRGPEEQDNLVTLTYSAATPQQGSLSLQKSLDDNLPVRVFRSTDYKHKKLKATLPSNGGFRRGRTYYRYDGLYLVLSVAQDEFFLLRRCGYNEIRTNQYRKYCQDKETMP